MRCFPISKHAHHKSTKNCLYGEDWDEEADTVQKRGSSRIAEFEFDERDGDESNDDQSGDDGSYDENDRVTPEADESEEDGD